MDKTVKKRSRDANRDAIVVLANWFQFSAGLRVDQTCVESRMLLWCRAGKGSLNVNGNAIEFSPGAWAFLPWKHRLLYEADAQHPFLVGGIHIIPCHVTRVPVVFQVAHHVGAALAHLPERRDALLPGLSGLIQGHFEVTDRLELLATYIVEKYQSCAPGELLMRELAHLLICELQAATEKGRLSLRPLPASMRRLQEYVRTHLKENIHVDDLARLADCSISSVHRLFRDYTGVTPARYVAQSRAEKAALLLRTTMLSVHEIGRRVGLEDPFHFSRFFKQKTGLSPRAYQRSRRFF